jgi:hypothetical protein
MIIDYDTVDRVLDAVEPILHDVAAKNKLTRARIERWIWDAPVVVLSWQGNEPPNMARNIAFHVLDTSGGTGPAMVANIEVNAWMDQDGMRRWQHAVAVLGARLRSLDELERDNADVRHGLFTAYEVVAGWTPGDLTKESQLRS